MNALSKAHTPLSPKSRGESSLDRGTDVWEGPFAEPNKYGGYTGAYYVRCTGCGVEVLTSDKRYARHRNGCPHM